MTTALTDILSNTVIHPDKVGTLLALAYKANLEELTAEHLQALEQIVSSMLILHNSKPFFAVIDDYEAAEALLTRIRQLV